MDTRYIVIADDFTGANDTGIQFLKAGYDASVILDPSALSSIEGEGVVVVDTESRNILAPDAAACLKTVAEYLVPLRGKRVVYKKVDSTLRGNIAAETAALRDVLGFAATAFTPAYPRNKRTVRDDLLLLDGVPVAETEMGRDPRKPVTTSSLKETLRGDSALKVRNVSLSEIRCGEIPEILKAAGNKGSYSFDVETDGDLQLIVNGMCAVLPPEDILWVGSAGMAEALVSRSRPAFFVVGSMSPKSALQARTLLQEKDVAPVLVNIRALLHDAPSEERRLSDAVSGLLRGGQSVLLASSLDDEQIEEGRSANASEIVCRSLAAVVSAVLDTALVSGMFITGGEVAIWIVRALGAGGTDLEKELEPGIPLVRLRGGKHHGLPVVTKAGAFGGERTMAECFSVLRGRK
jgi:uncharacterized protein YgbK (DUF1537 family)